MSPDRGPGSLHSTSQPDRNGQRLRPAPSLLLVHLERAEQHPAGQHERAHAVDDVELQQEQRGQQGGSHVSVLQGCIVTL